MTIIRNVLTSCITRISLVLAFTLLALSILLVLTLNLVLAFFVSLWMLALYLTYPVVSRLEGFGQKATTRQSHRESSGT